MTRIILSLAAVGILLSACTTSAPPVPAPSGQQAQVPTVQKIGIYSVYRDGVIGSGKKVVLFFYEDGAEGSMTSDTQLRALYSKTTVPLSTYRIPYGEMKELETRYSVRAENTFVVVDEQGKGLQTAPNPTPQALRLLLRG